MTKEEAIEIATQLAFYCGWPKAWSTFPTIVELVSSGNLPKRLPLGSDAVRIIRDELKSRLAEVAVVMSGLIKEGKILHWGISLSWMLCKKPYIVPIPSSRKAERIRENLGAVEITLTAEEVISIDGKLNHMEMSAVFGGSTVRK